MPKKKSDNSISSGWNAVRKVVPGGLGAVLLGSALTYGGARLLWRPGVETVRALGRFPATHIANISDAEWDARMDELRDDSEAKDRVPWYLAGLTGLGILAASWRDNEEFKGLGTRWDGQPANYGYNTNSVFRDGMHNTASLHKRADFTGMPGFVQDIDFGRTLNADRTRQLFSNDQFLAENDPYARNFGTSIIADAQRSAGTSSITLGGIYDSAVDKFKDKLSFDGIVRTGVRTVVANGLSRMFTGALDTMVGLSPAAQRNLIDAGTWAGAISSIID